MNKPPRFCSIIGNVYPEKHDGESAYCQYYCKLYRTLQDFKYRSEELKEDTDAERN